MHSEWVLLLPVMLARRRKKGASTGVSPRMLIYFFVHILKKIAYLPNRGKISALLMNKNVVVIIIIALLKILV